MYILELNSTNPYQLPAENLKDEVQSSVYSVVLERDPSPPERSLGLDLPSNLLQMT